MEGRTKHLEKRGGMSVPWEIEKRFRALAPDYELLTALRRANQKEYIRRRLRAVRLLWEGQSRAYVMEVCDISDQTLLNWLKVLVEQGVEAGLRRLVQPRPGQRQYKLSASQQAEVLRILNEDQPADYGYESHIFTAQMLVEIVARQWQIEVSDQTIYNLLARHAYSYQRAHRDYGTPDRAAQRAFQEALKKSERA
jgi:transposase